MQDCINFTNTILIQATSLGEKVDVPVSATAPAREHKHPERTTPGPCPRVHSARGRPETVWPASAADPVY